MSQITRTACLVALSSSLAPAIVAAQEIGWEANGRDVQGTRYLPAREIPPENVDRPAPARDPSAAAAARVAAAWSARRRCLRRPTARARDRSRSRDRARALGVRPEDRARR